MTTYRKVTYQVVMIGILIWLMVIGAIANATAPVQNLNGVSITMIPAPPGS